MKELNHQELERLYKEGTDADKAIYAEQRSNIQLVAGNHYSKKTMKAFGRLRDDRNLTEQQKIRITRNHIQRICKIYENNILTYAPDAVISAKNPTELQDQKAAELNNSVWEDLKSRHRFSDRVREYTQDFIRNGEVFVKIFWDETKGKLAGYEQQIDPVSGQPVFDEMGQPAPDMKSPKFTGDIVLERVYGFNVFRAKEAKSLDESWFIGIRKMAKVDDLKARLKGDEEKIEMIEESKDETYLINDYTDPGSYSEQKGMCLLKEIYVRPCLLYPNGYYFIYTNKGVLWEGELPFGVFPIVYAGFDEVPTVPRYHSIIKQVRPYQAEINRCASKLAETQITLGDDKLLVQAGTKIANGGMLPGVRAVQYAGQPPTILPGRAGDQYLGYMQQIIEEMYQVANVAEDMEEKASSVDPYTKLFETIEQKKKYVIYVRKFMRFLTDIAETSLSLLREYLPEDAIVPMVGRSEIVNIPEFKSTNPLNYSIKVESGTEDMESRLGKQLMFNQIIQYVGSNLDQKQLGMIIKNAPYANDAQIFADLTLDYDNATNMILSLDRGQWMEPNPSDDPDYMLKRITNRMRKADFNYLPDQAKQMYVQMEQIYVQIKADQVRKLQEAQLGLIPATGFAVPCDIYVKDPSNASKTMRARVPYDALNWLLTRLEEQQVSQAGMMGLQQQTQAQIAENFSQTPPQQQSVGSGSPPGQPILPS
jgi:hypothetical protein